MEFNDLQKKIIESIEGAYLISAPVGTGKTTVLVERIITALEKGFLPDEILSLTFTNRAAQEMVDRIKKRVGKKEVYDALTIKTFHGFCAYFIRAEAKLLGINSDFVIFDDDEQVEIMKNIMDEYPEFTNTGQYEKRKILNLIERMYNYRLSKLGEEIGCNLGTESLDENLMAINQRYVESLNDQNALDFNEIVLLTIRGLYLDKGIKNKWAMKYKFIQLDEFQDTHISEYLVIKELAKVHKNVALIGDLDQTIYGFRGSNPDVILKIFKRHFAPVKEFPLEINYRSDKHLLEAVKSFLRNFDNPATKIIECKKEEAGEEKCVEVFGGYNMTEEIEWIIKNIREKDKTAKIAVLARANWTINKVAEIFSQKGIAHITVDKYDFFKRQEIKDIYAYLKIIFNKFDLESACRLVSRPPRNIGLGTLKNIRDEGGGVCGLRVSDFLNFKNYNFPEPFFNLIDKWHNSRIIVLDTETTGTNVLKDEIIQIYAVEVINGKIVGDFHFYLRNTIPVGNSAAVHGLTDDFLRDRGRDPAAVLKELRDFIHNDIVAGHNINFDLSMISENAKRRGIIFEFKEYYDTLDISKRLVESENYKLTTLARLLGLPAATHDAKDDVLATAGLLEVLVEKLKAGQEQRIEMFKRFSKKFIQLSMQIDSWQKLVKAKRPAEALRNIWESSGLRAYYENDREKKKRFDSIETLVNIFKERDDLPRPPEVMLRELINYAALVNDINFLGMENGKIPIVTVHQVKGLEFDYIFIIGTNEFKFPPSHCDFEEEKRLFYVALTRARKNIYISYSNFDDYNKPINRSIFIDLIDQKYVKMFQ